MNCHKKRLKPLAVPYKFNSDECPSGSSGKHKYIYVNELFYVK